MYHHKISWGFEAAWKDLNMISSFKICEVPWWQWWALVKFKDLIRSYNEMSYYLVNRHKGHPVSLNFGTDCCMTTNSGKIYAPIATEWVINTLMLRQDCSHFPDDISKCIFLDINVWISIKILLNIVPKGPIDNVPALVQIAAFHCPGNKPYQQTNQWWLVYWCNSLLQARSGCNFKNAIFNLGLLIGFFRSSFPISSD